MNNAMEPLLTQQTPLPTKAPPSSKTPKPPSIDEKAARKQKEAEDTEALQKLAQDTSAELDPYYQNLQRDITHIDNRMSHIQQFITNLDAQVKNVQQLIQNDKNPGKKGGYYQIMNTCIELNATYEALYIRCMELKQRYRKEQDDFKIKCDKLVKIEIPRVKVDDDQFSLTPGNLAMMMQSLTKAIDNNDNRAQEFHRSIEDLNNDDNFKI